MLHGLRLRRKRVRKSQARCCVVLADRVVRLRILRAVGVKPCNQISVSDVSDGFVANVCVDHARTEALIDESTDGVGDLVRL